MTSGGHNLGRLEGTPLLTVGKGDSESKVLLSDYLAHLLCSSITDRQTVNYPLVKVFQLSLLIPSPCSSIIVRSSESVTEIWVNTQQFCCVAQQIDSHTLN